MGRWKRSKDRTKERAPGEVVSLRSTMRSDPPQGPRPLPPHSTQEDRKPQKLRKNDPNMDTTPLPAYHYPKELPSLPQNSRLIYTGSERVSETAAEFSEHGVPRKPVGGYDIENRPRRPHGSPEPSEIQRRHSSSQYHHQWPSLDESICQPPAEEISFMELQDEITSLKDENRKLQEERDSYIQKYKECEGKISHALTVQDDFQHENVTTEGNSEPTKKVVKKLKELCNEKEKEISKLSKENGALKDKKDELENTLKTWKAIQKDALDVQEKRFKREKYMVERELDEANKATAYQKTRAESLVSENKRLEKVIVELRSSLDQCKKEILDLETTKKAHKESVVFLERELEREVVKSKERSNDIRKAQESAFRLMMEPAKWMPKADTDVRRALDKLSEDLWNWVKTSVRKDIDPALLKSNATQQTLERLSKWSDGGFQFNPDDKRHCAKIPVLICMANITTLFYSTIFKSPFFWQEGAETGNNVYENSGIDLFEIYMDAVKADEKSANEWRCQLLRTFDPQIATDEPDALESKPEKCRQAAVDRFVTLFFSGDAKAFLDLDSTSNDTRLKQLIAISTKAARLSYRLWTQKTRLSILNAEDLNRKSVDGVIRFEHGAELVKHHPYHNVELSADEHALDGRPVALVTHPAIVAYGDASGERYREYKVWKKAEVWIG